jgi:hypothetical protein
LDTKIMMQHTVTLERMRTTSFIRRIISFSDSF